MRVPAFRRTLWAAMLPLALPPPPRVELTRVAVDRAAHTVDVRLRICFSSGPRAKIVVRERLTLAGRVRAARRWVPRGVEPTRIYPFACRAGWRLEWLVEPVLRGPGTYRASIQVVDAYGRSAPAVSFTVVPR